MTGENLISCDRSYLCKVGEKLSKSFFSTNSGIPVPGTRKHPSICESDEERMRANDRETIDGGEEEEMGKRRRTATSRACAERQDGCNTTRQRRPAPKLMYASADGRQTVPCRPQIKRAFDKMQKSAESRITKILLVAFQFPKSHNCIGASTQNVSFLELTISSMSPNDINSCDLFQIL